ncbi:MAG: CARDB domain-containing protein, partial [Halobacteriales archaeon]
QTAVSLSPDSTQVDVSNTTTFDVVVESADGGVGAHTTEVSLTDSSVAEITDVQLAGGPGLSDVSRASDNSSVSIDAGLMDTADTGTVTIASITVEGLADGTTGLNLSVSALGDERGIDYTVTDTNDATLTVGSPAAANQPPTANFTIDPTEPTVGENVVLLGAASSDPDGSITSYEWDLDGDGQYGDGNMAIEQFTTFDSPGNKTVGLRVTDNDSATDTVRKTLTVVAPGTANFSVSGLSAPPNATAGETITVNATVSNVGDVEGTTDAEFVFGGNVLLNQTVALGAGNSTQVSFAVPTAGVAPGTYEHGVQAGTSGQFANITIQQPATFEVSNLSAPPNATAGDTITVNATVSNVGDVEGTTDAEFVFGGNVLLNQTVALGAGNSTQVSFAVPTAGVAPGMYEHGVQAGNDSQFANITIQQPATFEVSDLSAPEAAVPGENVTVSATISNVGDLGGTTTAEFVFNGTVLLSQTVTLDGGNSTQVSFPVSTDGVELGTYEHGIQVTNDSRFANISIQESATFEVSNLSAPGTAVPGDTITVSATVSNVNDIEGNTTVEFVFGGNVLANQTVTLGGGNSTQVTFEVPTSGVAAGSYTHGVRVGDSFPTAQINLNAPPTASFSTGVDTVEVNETVTLDGTASTDSDGSIASYEWDLDGDGQYDDATGPTASVSFDATGEQTIGLRVTDDDGATSTTTVTVNVTERSDTISGDAPGFGIGVALAALIAVLLFARRRV